MATETQNAVGCCTDETKREQARRGPTQMIDRKVSLLVAAGAAMGANCETCLNKVVADLVEAGVPQERIRGAVQVGQMVKDKPAARMKELADALTGSQLAQASASMACPMDGMPRDDAYKVAMLIAAGSAMAAGCEPCLNKAIPDLIESSVADADIRRALVIGQQVKDQAAAILKDVADVLAGTRLSDGSGAEGCPDDVTATADCCR